MIIIIGDKIVHVTKESKSTTHYGQLEFKFTKFELNETRK